MRLARLAPSGRADRRGRLRAISAGIPWTRPGAPPFPKSRGEDIKALRESKCRLSLRERAFSEKRCVSPILSALIATGLGEHDRAFAWLEKAYEDRAQMLSEIKADPTFDAIRPDPRFVDLLRRVGSDTAD